MSVVAVINCGFFLPAKSHPGKLHRSFPINTYPQQRPPPSNLLRRPSHLASPSPSSYPFLNSKVRSLLGQRARSNDVGIVIPCVSVPREMGLGFAFWVSIATSKHKKPFVSLFPRTNSILIFASLEFADVIWTFLHLEHDATMRTRNSGSRLRANL